MTTEAKREEVKIVTSAREGEKLLDYSTGTGHHPHPLEKTTPLVDPRDNSREYPYKK